MLEEGGLECRLEANRAELSHVTKLANLGSSSQQDMGIYEAICHDNKTYVVTLSILKCACPVSAHRRNMICVPMLGECASM